MRSLAHTLGVPPMLRKRKRVACAMHVSLYVLTALAVTIIADENNDHYLLVEIGLQGEHRIYSPLINLDIINDKIWIQHDVTEEGVAS